MTKEDAVRKIEENWKEISRLISESRELTKEHSLGFDFPYIRTDSDDHGYPPKYTHADEDTTWNSSSEYC